MQASIIVSIISLAFSLPVFALSYYALILFLSAFRYPKSLGSETPRIDSYHRVSILVTAYNERFVIGRTLDALKNLKYPRDEIQVVVADDSTDETSEIIEKKVEELKQLGIISVVSRRLTRENFKSGALNNASRLLTGEYVLLLDADSTVPSDVLAKGIDAFRTHPDISFVSYRVGHYNREQNLITRLFALFLDSGDTLGKMGSYSINAPFSFQGGFTLISKEALSDAGFWSNDTIVDDADLSCKLYCSGRKGIYLSKVRIFSEDPFTLEVWKKQAARVSQGWAKCLAKYWRSISTTQELSIGRRVALFLTFLAPFASLSWIIVTFLSAFAVVLGLSAPGSSIFSNPIYVVLVTVPVVTFFGTAAYSLYVQKIMTVRNLALIPILTYAGSSMLTANSIGFLSGISGRMGLFFRTPKAGQERNTPEKMQYFQSLTLDRLSIVEFTLSVIALALSVLVSIKGMWFLGVSLFGFGVLTLKSMNLSRSHVRKAPERGIELIDQQRTLGMTIK